MIEATNFGLSGFLVRRSSMNVPWFVLRTVLLRVILFVSFSIVLAFAFSAHAQDEGESAPASPAAASPVSPTGSIPAATAPPKAGSTKEGKKNVVNFEDQLVEGQTQKPELFYLLQQRNNNFKRLIRLRENFLPEMRSTAEEIGRSRGSNSGAAQKQGQ